MRGINLVRVGVLGLIVAAGSAIANRTDDHAPAKPKSQPAPATKPEATKPEAKKPEAKAHGEKSPTKPDPKADEHDAPKPDHADPHADPHTDPAANPATDKHDAPATMNNVPAAHASTNAADPVQADDALKMLKEGNERWVADQEKNPNTESSRRQATSEGGQHPFVTVLTCADSRLPVERIFDRGVGDVFVVRVAGNVAGTSESGTIEYGLGHLKTPLLVVMGHTKCGAVAAAASGKDIPGDLGALVHNIDPAVARARQQNPGVDEAKLASLAIRENVWQSIFDLCRRSEEVRTMIKEDKVQVVGAIYDITTGKVEWLGEHPWQAQLLDVIDSRQNANADDKHE
jgi:carbonic anhydrase